MNHSTAPSAAEQAIATAIDQQSPPPAKTPPWVELPQVDLAHPEQASR